MSVHRSVSPGRPMTAPGSTGTGSVQIRQRAPGPGAYAIPSGIGKQVTSTMRSSATLSFGTGPRDDSKRGGDAPGPGAYYKMLPPGSSAVSTMKKSPAYTMRSREKFGSTIDTGASQLPGPGAYTKIFNPKLSNPPSYTMAARNFPTFSMGLRPAPNAYKTSESVGKQALSTRSTAPVVVFGTSERKDTAKPQTQVGPGQYSSIASLGTQVVSGKRSSPAVSMSARPKDRTIVDSRAGPGSYRPLEGFGKQPLSLHKTTPAVSMSGRTLFGSPYNI